jgi:hypothetical protein
MQPIDLHNLETVRGGIGALLGGLAKAAGPILNGVAGIVGAAKSGGGGGGAPAPAQAPAGPPPSGMGGGTGEGLVSVSVTINGVQAR